LRYGFSSVNEVKPVVNSYLKTHFGFRGKYGYIVGRNPKS
jgi:hypothetical protein